MTGKYEVLTEHLRGRSEPTVILSFAELARIVDTLPASARQHAAWWANTRTGQPQARAWLDAGRRAKPDFNGGLVRFEIGLEAVSRRKFERSSIAATSDPAAATGALLEPTGEHGSAAVSFSWRSAGPVVLEDGELRFPELPAVGGVYRFTLTPRDAQASTYVGETDNLARRMTHYRRPGPSQPTNQRMQLRLTETLRAGGAVRVAVVLESDVDGESLPLADKAGRRLLENLVLLQLARSGHAVENL